MDRQTVTRTECDLHTLAEECQNSPASNTRSSWPIHTRPSKAEIAWGGQFGIGVRDGVWTGVDDGVWIGVMPTGADDDSWSG